MGIYFLAAGSASRNREKTLDKGHRVDALARYLDSEHSDELRSCFGGQLAYLWGANKEGDLGSLSRGSYVVDVKNRRVIQVFRFGFFVVTSDTRLQDHVGWDQEKPKEERRPYRYVYFLSSPINTRRTEKAFFQSAFGLQENQNWLVGQRYFDDLEVAAALESTRCSSVEQLLGIEVAPVAGEGALTARSSPRREVPRKRVRVVEEAIAPPDWLRPLTEDVKLLQDDADNQERDHEDLVARFFEILGYRRTKEIKFRRGRIDVLITKDDAPLITIEVKQDWSLSPSNKDYVAQAYRYAHELGTRHVIVTNGDRYLVYDRDMGRTYDENLSADFQLTALREEDLASIEGLRRGKLV